MKTLSLTLHRLGCLLEWLGAKLNGCGRHELRSLKRRQQADRQALKAAWKRAPQPAMMDAALIVWTILCVIIWLNLLGVYP